MFGFVGQGRCFQPGRASLFTARSLQRSSVCMARLACVSQVFTKRGFLTKLLFASADITKLEEVDNGLTATLRDLQVALQVESISLQRASYDEMRAANEALMQKIQSLGGAQARTGCARTPCPGGLAWAW
jgi:hypothetical protein